MLAAARMIGFVPGFGYITEYIRDVLHWLLVQQDYRNSSIVWHFVIENVPAFLLELFILTSTCSGS